MTSTTSDIGPTKSAGTKAIVGWALFDWAAQPYYALITTFIFAPYFVNVFASDPVQGQAQWGYVAALAGIFIAIISPILGSIADVTGGKKPWIALFSLAFVLAMTTLWLAEPGPNAPIFLIMAAIVVATISGELQIVFTNAIMPTLVPREKLGRLSGIGWATGYAAALVSLIIFAGLITTVPETGKTLLGFDPIIKLDSSTKEAERLSGPFAAIWFIIFSIPFFLWTPDATPPRQSSKTPVADGLSELKSTILSLRQYKNIALFLIARLFYIDGLSAIFVFGGIYGTAVFGWSSTEIGLFGIIITIAAAIGAVAGGPLDDRYGPKTLVIWSLVGLLIGTVGVLSIDKTHIFFVTEVEPKTTSGGLFASTGEQAYLMFGMLIGIVSGPIYSASRTLLAHLAPKEKLTQFYGLYAFSGKVTAFAAPLLVAQMTEITQSQRLGVIPIAFFLIVGLTMMLFVKDEPTAE